MTLIDNRGKKTHTPKEIWLDKRLFDITYQIENELCRQLNKGIWKLDNKEELEKAKAIQEFIERSKI